MLSMLLLAFVLPTVPSAAVAQSTPQKVTMRTGTEIVGQIASVTGFSVEQPNPWGAQQICLVDDGLRRVFFNFQSAANVTPLDDLHPMANPTEFEIWQRLYGGRTEGSGNLMLQPFNEFGHRLVRSRTKEGIDTFIQGITRITPHFCEVATLTSPESKRLKQWTMSIATSSVSPDVLRNLMDGQIRDRDNPSDYLTIVDFFRDSQQYKMAEDQLVFIGQKFPDMADVIDEQKQRIRQARARQWIREVDTLIEVGQPQLGGLMLGSFDRTGIAGEILAEMAEIQDRLDDEQDRVEATKKPIIDLLDKFIEGDLKSELEPEQQPMVARFKQDLESELNPNNVSRLDAFNRFANDPNMSNLERLSTAISGWFLGTNKATELFAVSQSFYTVRDLVQEYLTKADATRRQEILEELTNYEGGEPEYLAPLIAQMTPPAAPDLTKLDTRLPLSFEFTMSGSKADEQDLKFQYHVQLPREYDPHRRYPCVVTLPGDKNIERQMMMWCGPLNEKLGTRFGQAMRNGYIVVAIDWKLPGQFEYKYTAREHNTIMRAFRKALTQFSIDTDRVFLTGHGFGADAAYDIGIAHPEHWAGIVGVSGKIDKYPDLYREHEHIRLPIYSVVGEKDTESIKPSQDAWNKWLLSKQRFECTVVEYKGRSNELFVEEIVEIFKWMAGHRRRLPDLGGFAFKGKIRRPWDNYFWFYELHDIPRDKVVWPEFFGQRHPKPITMTAKVTQKQPDDKKRKPYTEFRVGPSRQGSGATLWLSPEYVDFQNKIVVEGRGKFNDFVVPSREVMLEDVRRNRCDRQHPYWANIQCEGQRWEANKIGE